MNADFFHSVAAARIIFSLGIVNLLTLAALLTTCRCLPTSRIGKNLMKHPRYKKFYGVHCYLWYILAGSVSLHVFMAVMFAGIPF